MEADSQGQISLVFDSDRRKEWSEGLSEEMISELTCVRVGCWSGEDGGGVQAGGTQDVARHSPGTKSRAYLSTYCVLASELGSGEMVQPGPPLPSELGQGLGVEEIIAGTLWALELAQPLCPGKQVSLERPPLTLLLPVPLQVARCQPGAGGERAGVRGCPVCCAEQGPPQPRPRGLLCLCRPPGTPDTPQPGL